ncbi:MAG: VTT domain-containing protein [Alphaproteobacteria bacterium]|nr:VTT domain-containing protein [Alphaproteobacteria bacterium]
MALQMRTKTSQAKPLGDARVESEGDDFWRATTADRASVLIDAAAYYGALRKSLLEAQRSVFIVGWDVDSRTRLVGPEGEADDGYPEELGPFLAALMTRRPELRINILLWDYSMVYALEREPLPTVNLDWKTPEGVSICLDDQLPFGSSHHQKIVVIDDAVAYSGGLDLTIRRWDTPDHRLENPRRVDPADEPYRPFHDIQIVLDGGPARDLAELVRKRWRVAACETPPEIEPQGDPWPGGLRPDFEGIEAAIARTMPAYQGHPEVREVAHSYADAIASARNAIYIETQYLTGERIARSLARSLSSNPELEVVIVGPNVSKGWLEDPSMIGGRARVMAFLEDAGVGDRVRLLYPALPDDPTGEGTMVHAKFMTVDDRSLRVGSANLNNRSMGTDSECDIVLIAGNDDHRRKIAEIRNRLLGEHLDVDAKEVGDAIAAGKSLIGAVDSLAGDGRTLKPIETEDAPDEEIATTIGLIADPERPILGASEVGDRFGVAPGAPSPTRWSRVLALALAALVVVGLWRFTALADLTHPEELVEWLRQFSAHGAMPFILLTVFVIGGTIGFPVTVLIAVTAMMMSPGTAFLIAVTGSILSAWVGFRIGHVINAGWLRQRVGTRFNRVNRALAAQGITSVAVLRMLPIAPFTLINLAAGASRIRTFDFLVGSALGMVPGIALLVLLGHQLSKLLSDPDPAHYAYFALAVALMLGLGLLIQHLSRRIRATRDD